MFYSYIVADSDKHLKDVLSKLSFPADITIHELQYYIDHDEFDNEEFAILGDNFRSENIVVLIPPKDMLHLLSTKIIQRCERGFIVKREDNRVAITVDKHKKQPYGKITYIDI